jgi:LacI family transcriptional regulator
VIQELRDSGRRIPTDVAVVGFDDIPLAAHTEPALTTVRQPLREMGAAAAHMLLSYFEGSPVSETRLVIPTTLVVRGST